MAFIFILWSTSMNVKFWRKIRIPVIFYGISRTNYELANFCSAGSNVNGSCKCCVWECFKIKCRTKFWPHYSMQNDITKFTGNLRDQNRQHQKIHFYICPRECDSVLKDLCSLFGHKHMRSWTSKIASAMAITDSTDSEKMKKIRIFLQKFTIKFLNYLTCMK